jgi:type I restriction enzyme S subunit
MSHWKEYKLGEIADINKKTIGKGYNFEIIEYVDTSSVTENAFDNPQVIPLAEAPSRAKRLVNEGDTIISTVRPIQKHYGYIKDAKPNTVVSTGFAVVSPKAIDPKFLFYFLTQEEITIYLNTLAESGTTTFPAFRPDELVNLTISAPESIADQTAIASILSSLDEKIELNNAINRNLEALAQALFKQWFVEFNFPVDDHGNFSPLSGEMSEGQRGYKDSGGEMVDSELGEIPKGWTISTFKEHLNVCRGLSYNGAGLTDKMNGVPMHNLNSVYEGGGYKFEGIKYYSGEFKERHILKPWDLIVTNTEQGHKFLLIGCPAFVPKYFGSQGIFSHHIYKVETKEDSYLNNQFVYYLMLHPSIREQIVGCTNGTTVNMLKISGLEVPMFKLPPQSLVTIFSEYVKSIWEKLEVSFEENHNLKKIRDTLLPKLISGELEVKDINTVSV